MLPSLQLQYVGKKLAELHTPAAILDRTVVKRNCDAMLDVCAQLQVGFRAHVKSHKVGPNHSSPTKFSDTKRCRLCSLRSCR